MSHSHKLQSNRAKKARLARRIPELVVRLLASSLYIFGVAGGLLLVLNEQQAGLIFIGSGFVIYMFVVWYQRDLKILPVDGKDLEQRLSSDVLGLLKPGTEFTPKTIWKQLSKHWQARFFTNRLMLHPADIGELLSGDEADVEKVWQKAAELAGTSNEPIELGHVVAALMLTSDAVSNYCKKLKIAPEAIPKCLSWLMRGLASARRKEPYFGGIGRDWASGFTPQLNRYGSNISQTIEHHGAHFGALTKSAGVTAMKNSLSQGASAIVLVGESGAGKTSHVYALAQSLLSEQHDPLLRHHQVIGLDASTIVSSAQQKGQLEQIVMTLVHEAAHAGNIILFLDDASLFLQDGHGSFNASQLLMPVVQSRALQLVLALSPHDFQQLKVSNPAFANMMTPIILSEPSEDEVQRILEDTALNLEHRHKVLITYNALVEAYKQSGRYMQDIAYPGKAIKLLEQALSYQESSIVTANSVQKAIEQSRGVKLSSASPAETDQLLNLESRIHERMINQKRAVEVVSNALRRARAGVANLNRPIGSFLFLGPTGVGKTELAKAISAIYFGSEDALIRIDMSEYQQPDDVKRLLSDGTNESSSLIMSVRKQPYAVVLLDEIEKAHPNILNLLLQLLDEGQLTDGNGKPVSFRDCVIITTSNAGAASIREHIDKGEDVADFEASFTDELINSGQFKPELINRFDEIVIFRPLTKDELHQIVALMVAEVNKTLAGQNIIVELTNAAVGKIVDAGYDPRLGARPMRRVVQRTIEDVIARKILEGTAQPGDKVTLDGADIAA